MNLRICVLIPTYDRADILEVMLQTWLRSKWITKAIIVADASNKEHLNKYKEKLMQLNKEHEDRVTYIINVGRSGSINARNKLLKLAQKENCHYAIMADDDYILPNPEFPLRMASWFLADKNVGAVGGRIILMRKRAVDPDFFLNAPVPIADPLTRILGYVMLDVKNGPRYAEYLPHFFMIRKDLIDRISYAQYYEATAFREESDLQRQIKKLGYKLILDPHVYVYHLGAEYGGDRSEIKMSNRMYWKARNHTIFIIRWYNQPLKTWYLITAAILLILYRPWHILQVLKGIKDGLKP